MVFFLFFLQRIVENNIGTEGARVICDALRKNNYVRRLDLKGNGVTPFILYPNSMTLNLIPSNAMFSF